MAQTLEEWITTEVEPVKNMPLRRVAEEYFFRDPARPIYTDDNYFFSPADGVIIYQKLVNAEEDVVDLKGRTYSLRDAMRIPYLDGDFLVIGIFMTLYDVHVNRIPYSGRLTYEWLPPIETQNHPMLDVEQQLLDELHVGVGSGEYLHSNERVLNRVYVPNMGQSYYLLQLADYDVRCITPFELRQNWPVSQNERFSQIRFGSQVDLILPISDRVSYERLLELGMHVQAGVDPLVAVSTQAPCGCKTQLSNGNFQIKHSGSLHAVK